MKVQLLAKLMLLSLFISVGSYAQNGTKLIGFDAVTSGRGGVSTAMFDNPSLMMNNPAGLSFLKQSQLDASVSIMSPSVYFKNGINDAKGKSNIFPLGCLSYAKATNKKLTYALGVFTQGGMGADFDLNHYLYTDNAGKYVKQPYHSKFAVMQGGASLAYKITPKLSIGASAFLVYSMMEFQMPMSMPPAMMRGVINPSTGFTFGDMFAAAPASGGLGYSEVVASANMKSLASYTFNGKIGLAYKPTDKLSFGINYTMPTSLNYKNGKADMDMTAQMNNAFSRVMAGIMQQNPGYTQAQAQAAAMGMFGSLGIDLTKGANDKYDATAKFSLPQSISAGLSYAANNKLTLGMDVEWVNWSDAFDQMDIELKGGTNTNINKMMGTSGVITMPFPLNWKDVVVVRTGAEYKDNKKLTVRGGYAYGDNPVPATTIFPVFPAVVKHHVSVGGSYCIAKNLKINAGYEHAFRNDQTASNPSTIGKQFDGSKSGLANNIYHLSLSWMLK